MATLMIFHEVDDVEHWLASPKREELFGPLGITVRTFRDPQGSHGNPVIQEHGNAAIEIPLTQHAQHGLSAAIFKIAFRRSPLHNIKMPDS